MASFADSRRRRHTLVVPTGAAVPALSDGWTGITPATSDLVVIGADAIGTGVLAVRLFRWD